jgi:hypothetical protein
MLNLHGDRTVRKSCKSFALIVCIKTCIFAGHLPGAATADCGDIDFIANPAACIKKVTFISNVVYYSKPGFSSVDGYGDIVRMITKDLNVNLVSQTQLKKFVSRPHSHNNSR